MLGRLVQNLGYRQTLERWFCAISDFFWASVFLVVLAALLLLAEQLGLVDFNSVSTAIPILLFLALGVVSLGIFLVVLALVFVYLTYDLFSEILIFNSIDFPFSHIFLNFKSLPCGVLLRPPRAR